MMDLYYAIVNVLRLSLLLMGSLVIFAGIFLAALEARAGGGSRGRVARQIGSHAALGLEYFIGATVLNLIVNPSWTAVATTALTIVVRKLITLSLEGSV